MKPDDYRKLTVLLFNPFVYIAGAKALLIGSAAILLAGFIGALSNTHFDGVLDTHTGLHVPLWIFLAEGFIDWLSLALVLWIIGRIASRTPFRTIDLLGTQAMARWPTIFMSLIVLPKAFRRFSEQLLEQLTKPGAKLDFSSTDALIFSAVVVGMILLLCWVVVLMYKAYSVSCNLKGAKGVLTFIAGIVLAEILSKVALYWLLKMS